MNGPDTRYAELSAASNFSFLRGASSPQDMVRTARILGHCGIGIADRNTVAGVVRAHVAMREIREKFEEEQEGVETETALDFKLAVGARLVFADDTPDILAYPATRHGWGRLTRLLTTGNMRAEKGDCILHWTDLLHFHEDLHLIVIPPAGTQILTRLAARFSGRLWLGATMLRQGRDARLLAGLQAQSAATGIPLIALNDALYSSPEARPLHDILTAIREKTTVQAAGRKLLANAEKHLKPPQEMARLFAMAPEAIAATEDFLSRIHFTLEDLHYEYPHEPVPPGYTPQGWLTELVWSTAQDRWPEGIPEKLQELLHDELAIVADAQYAPYFLTVHDIVRFAQSQNILCQGRGSAANSAICFVLGITAVNPAQHNLLFSRFISPERKEPPDIDVDFEHERREEVMQYIYKRYGRDRAGIVATVIHYRPRSAVREVGKALGLSEDVTARLASTVWGSHSSSYNEQRSAESGLDPSNPEIARVNHFTARILQFPRHLSQHVGGFVLTQDRLDETVPIHNAAMENRTFIEWDKDDIDALGLMKVDVLALGMLTCIRKAFHLIDTHIGRQYRLDNVPDRADDVFEMLQRGDSIGVFQVESRAQMNMLPRLGPKNFYDLAIQVAIVRPGPIQGDMVHPYLRRRQGAETVDFPSPAPPHDPEELHNVLGKTLGVPLFQEQAMKLAIIAADFSPAEANRLRRAMATFRNLGTMENFEDKLVEGMAARGYERDFALRCFRQIEGFGSYGFPESHALAFARLVWVSAYIKCRYPAVFAAALLNAQPMGFYAPAQIIRDAREHGVEVRRIDINHSFWDNAPERRHDGSLSLRLGFRQIGGFKESWADNIERTRPFDSVEQLARKAGLPQRALRLLADGDAFDSIGLERREALWEARRTPPDELPLFAAARARELGEEPAAGLPAMSLSEQVVADYQTFRLSLKAHPMSFLRPVFDREGISPCAALTKGRNEQKVKVAGVVLVRQRPGKGNAIFITLEDEGGIANIVIWARLFERFRREVMAARLMLVEGTLQVSKEGVTHVMATHIHDRTAELNRLSHQQDSPSQNHAANASHRHPRNVRILPNSRDFH
ncbi:DNA polymerase III subunit alpha [Altericroceibacterium spongiae]|uniref:Error-prone DNA polymerase n=1 Tax=Altericroceibacterium spongiae TaxID=2320269 RepID=A0A420EQR4_9SPHN|nr:error-prone DNA polymerase [Altericroceibacterium spongiae]RKF23019.1 DNA polymerase III subunit alpha [Altericroceibacterium spongiae]